MEWLVTGPIDNKLEKFGKIHNCNIIIIGDSCLYNNMYSKILKEAKNSTNVFYCVRGGLDKNPRKTPNLVTIYDEIVGGVVYFNTESPNIRFFENGQIYTINNKKVLVIGGGKSLNENDLILKGTTVYSDNVYTAQEMQIIENFIQGKEVDIVLSYTGPYSWETPSKADESPMERWLDIIKNKFTWKSWVFSKYKKDVDLDNKRKEIYQDLFLIDEI